MARVCSEWNFDFGQDKPGTINLIWESRFWKGDLLRVAASIRRRTNQKRWPDASAARCEQEIMIGFYSIRKLIEARKISDSLATYAVPVRVYPKKARAKVNYLNRYDLDRHFDFRRVRHETRPLRFLCNQVIHSYVFCLVMSEDGSLQSVDVASDKERDSQLFEIDAIMIAEVFGRVGNNYPRTTRAVSDPRLRDYKVTCE